MTVTCTCSHAQDHHGPTGMGLGNYLPGNRCQLTGCDCLTFTPHTEEPALTDTTPHVTPEIIRAVRDQLFEPLDHVHAVLTTAAVDLEGEQAAQAERRKAEEARIDEYARVALRAGAGHFGLDREFDEAQPRLRELYRVIARAVLAHLAQEQAAAAEQSRAVGTIHSGLISVSPDEDGAIADGPPFVHGRDFTVGDRRPAGEPRTWDNLRKVPEDVQKVTDNAGSVYRRRWPGARGWEVHAVGTMWSRDMDDDLAEWAPFTEVIDRG